jgi:outer membrane protein assembly factor BamB
MSAPAPGGAAVGYPIAARSPLAVARTDDGQVLIFSIDSAQALRVTAGSDARPTGWTTRTISAGMPCPAGASVAVKAFGAAQAAGPDGTQGPVTLVAAVTATTPGGHFDQVFAATLPADAAAPWVVDPAAIVWVPRPFDFASTQLPLLTAATLDVADVMVTTLAGGNPFAVVTLADPGNGVERPFVVALAPGRGAVWTYMVPEQDYTRLLDSAPGQPRGAVTAGIYKLYSRTVNDVAQVALTFKPIAAQFPARFFQVSPDATAIAPVVLPAGPGQGYTALLVADGGSLTLFPAWGGAQDEGAYFLGTPVARGAPGTGVLDGVSALHAVVDGALLSVCGVNGAGQVFYLQAAFDAAGGLSGWSVPLSLLDNVVRAAPYLSESRRISAIYAVVRDPATRMESLVGLSCDPLSDRGWSQHPIVPSAVDIALRQLLDRLLRNRPGPGTVSLDATSLAGPGDADRVLAVLRDALAVDRLAISLPTDPTVADEALVLAGTADVMGAKAAAVRAELTVDETLSLQLVLRVDLPAGWTLGDGFPELARTPFATMPLTGATLYVSTWAHSADGVPFPLQPGLNLAATYAVTPDLRVAPDPTAPGTVPIAFGGAVQRTPSLRFALAGTGRLQDLVAHRQDQAPLSFTGGTALLSYAVDGAGNATASAALRGRTLIAGQEVAAVLDLPTLGVPSPTLRTVDGALTLPSLGDAVAQVAGGLDIASVFPPTLLALTGLTDLTMGFTWDPTGARATTGFLEARSADWVFAPGLALQRPTVVLEVRQPVGDGIRLLSGHAGGTLQLGASLTVNAAVAFTSGRRWYVTLQDQSASPPLETLAAFLSSQSGGLIPPLPESLRPLTDLATPREVYFGGDAFAGTLDEAGFSLGQRQPWPALPGVTVSGFSVAVTATKEADGWSATGRLEGSVTLGTGADAATFHVEMPIPRQPGVNWRICLDDASAVRIPTLRQVLDLAGGAAIPLPEGIATLGGLDVTALTITFDPTAPALRHVGLCFAQDGVWTIIPAPAGGAPLLAARGLEAALSVRTGPLAALGEGSGLVTVLGTEVDFTLLKPAFDGDWELRAGWDQPVRVPGLADLADWMGGDGARNLLATVPLFGQGGSFSNLRLRFAGDTGRLRLVGFRFASVQPCSVIGGRLSLTDVYAELVVPTQGSVTGELRGVVTIGGVTAQLRAARPTERDPWTFTGGLFPSAPLNLLDAANEVSEAPLGLPADAQPRWNLPSLLLRRADVTATPQTGAYTFAAALEAEGWSFGFAATTLTLRQLSGRVEKAGTDAPLVARVLGHLTLGSLDVWLGMQIGAAGADTVLTGALTSTGAQEVDVGALADGLAGATGPASWAAIVPGGLPSALSGGSATFNLTRGIFLLTGTLSGYASAFFLGRRVDQGGGVAPRAAAGAVAAAGSTAAEGTAPAEDSGAAGTALEYLFAAALGEGFTFGRLFPGLAPVDDVIWVQDARLAVYSVGAGGLAELKGSMAALAGLPPAVQWPLPDALAVALPARSGVLLTAAVQLHAPALFDRVLEIGTLGNETLRVVAVIDWADASNSLFGVRLPDITVLRTITLANGAVTFRPGDRGRLNVAADLLFGEIFGRSFAFHGTMILAADAMRGTLDLLPSSPGQAVGEPFGIPGIAVEQLKAEVACTFGQPGPPPVPKSSRFSLLGTVRLGRPPAPGTPDARAAFNARLALRDGTPTLLAVDVAEDLDVGGFLAQTVTGSSSAWPSSFIDLSFAAGSRLYYYSAAADPAPAQWAADPVSGAVYREGLHVDALVRLTLVGTLTLRLTLEVVQRDGLYVGVTASAGLTQPVDLLFVSLAGPALQGDGYVSGPALSLTTVSGASPSFGFQAGINFLDKGLATANVQVSRPTEGGTRVDGRVESARSFDPFGKLAFDFTYTRTSAGQNRFQLRNWPSFDWARQIIDVVAQVRSIANAAASAGGCGSLAALATNTLLETTYRVIPSADADGDDLVFGLVVSCQMRIQGASDPFLTSALPAISFRVPKTTRFDDLPESMASGIASAGPAFARSLLDDPEALSLFLAMTFGKAGVGIALELVCRGLTNSAVPTATGAAAGAISAAGGPVAAVAVGVGAIAGIVSTISGIVAGGSPGGGGAGTITLGEAVLVEAKWVGNGVHARWQAAPYAAGYELQLASGGTVLHAVDVEQAQEGDLVFDPASLASGSNDVRVATRRGGDRTTSNPLPVVKLAKPTVSLVRADQTLTATASGDADTFRIQFYGPDGAALASVQVTASAPSTSILLPSLATGQYAAAAEALRDGAIPSGIGYRATLDLLPAPSSVAVRQAGARAAVSWNAVSDPSATYAVRLMQAGSPAGEPVTGHTAPPAMLDLPSGAAPGTAFGVQVRAATARQTTGWSETVTLTLLPVPEGLALLYDAGAGAMLARWSPLAAGTPGYAYGFALLRTDGTPAALAQSGLTQPAAQVSGIAFQAGETYRGHVRTERDGSQGAWSDPVQVTIQTPLPVTGMRVSFDGATGQVTASWAPPNTDPHTYDAQVVQAGAVVAEAAALSAPMFSTVTPAAAFTVGTRYTVRARVTTAATLGPWVAADFTPIAALTAAPVLSFQAETNPARSAVTATWQDQAGASFLVYTAIGDNAPLRQRASATEPRERITGGGDLMLTDGAVLRVAVQVDANDVRSALSPEARLQLVLLRAPADLALSYAEGALTASWTVDPRATDVTWTLADANGAVLDAPHALVPPLRWPRSKAIPLAPGTEYVLTGRARAGASAGPSGSARIVLPALDKLAVAGRAAGQPAADVVRALLAVYDGVPETALEVALLVAGFSPADVEAVLGPPLRAWIGAYTTSTEGLGRAFDLSINADGTVTVGGQPLAFSYDQAEARLTWDSQSAGTTPAKGDITFSNGPGGPEFWGTVTPRPQDGPAEYAGSLARGVAAWPSALNGPANTGRSLFRGPLRPNVGWLKILDGNLPAGPAVDESGRVYVGGGSRLYALYPNGATCWAAAFTASIGATPALSGNTIYAGADGLIALEPSMAGQRWRVDRRDVGMIVTQPPKVSPDGATVYVLAESSVGKGDRLLAIDVAGARQKWEFVIPGGRATSACGIGADGTVYVGSETRVVYALDRGTGEPRWRYQDLCDAGFIRGPVVVDPQGTVYFVRVAPPPQFNVVGCLNPDGTLRWEYLERGDLAVSPSLAIGADGTVYASLYGMTAISPDGQRRWSTPTAGDVGLYPGPACVDRDGSVYFGARDGFYAYDANGGLLWYYGGGRSDSLPAIAGDGLLVFTAGAMVHMLRE